MNKQEVYGAYDCVANSFLSLMHLHGCRLEPVRQYNWDILYTPDHDLFYGSITPETWMSYLPEHAGMKVETCSLEEVPEEEWCSIPLDTFDLPYIKAYYGKVHQLHHVPSVYRNGKFRVRDPYYQIETEFPASLVHASWAYFGSEIFRFIRVAEREPAYVPPHLAKKNYRESYERYFMDFRNALQMLEDHLKIHESVRFMRYYGSLQTILRNRQLHFMASRHPRAERHRVLIESGWVAVQREIIKMALFHPRDKDSVYESMERVIRYEIDYLRDWQ